MTVRTIPPRGSASNSYLLISGGEAVLIDPSSPPHLAASLLGESRVRYILLTHGHFDHVSAVGELKDKYPGCAVYIHRGDELLMRSGDISYADSYGITVHPKTRADVLLSDGDTVEWHGKTFTVMHTPGHTKGSVCYISGDVMFSGDTLFAGSVGTTSLYGGDEEEMSASLEKLKALGCDFKIFPGHGGQTTLEYEKQNNPFLKYGF